MKLELRSAGAGPFFVGMHEIGGVIDGSREPAVGDTAMLKSGRVYVQTLITKVDGNVYEGEIVGFEGYDAYEYKGKRPGDVIRFSYDNILACSR